MLRDVQEHAARHQGDDERRSSVGDEGQGDAGRRQQAEHDRDVNQGLNRQGTGEAPGEIAAEGVWRSQSGDHSAPEKDAEEKQHAERSNQAELLANDRVDKIGVRVRHIVELLQTIAQADPEETPRADRDERLEGLETGAERIRLGRQKRQKAAPAGPR